jgi:hypothetical protein
MLWPRASIAETSGWPTDPMQIWSGFYAVVGGATATLLGLLFVAVSINASAILSEEHASSKRLAEQALQNYLTVLSVALLALFPSLTLQELGFSTLGVTGLSVGWALMRLYQAFRKSRDDGWRRRLRSHFSSFLGFVMLTFAAVHMAFDLGDSRTLFATAAIILLFSATRVSWQILLSIAKTKQAQPGAL